MHERHQQRFGFTLVEVSVALSLSLITGIGILSLLLYVGNNTRWGGFQVRYNIAARRATHRIARSVESAKAVGASTNSLNIMMTDLRTARIEFQDGDDPTNLHNNRLILIPNTANANQYTVLATHVSPIPGESMFGTIPTTPRTARVVFRIGDSAVANARAFSRSGQDYHGVEVRLSATPRNLQRWYETQ